MNFWRQSLVASAVMALAACGSSSSGGSDDQKGGGPGDSTEYGYVIDGYLEKARVCFDANSNSVCDNDESSQQTNAAGQFDLAGLKDKAILAQAIAGITKDEDDNGSALTQSFILMSPVGYNGIVTPFTTLLATFQNSGLTQAQAEEKAQQALGLTQAQLIGDYVAGEDADAKKIAKTLVLTAQEVARQALVNPKYDPSEIADKVQLLAWQQMDEAELTSLVGLVNGNADATPDNLVAQWMTASPTLALTEQEIEGDGSGGGTPPNNDTDNDGVPNDSDNCPTVANPGQEDLDGDGIGSACDDSEAPLTAFTKLSSTGTVLADSATDYACVIQNTAADGTNIPVADRDTWMLLIPEDATYASLGVSAPQGNSDTDKFWEYSWGDSDLDQFEAPNTLEIRYTADNQVEIYVELLNKINYCGFNDWTVPSLAQMQVLNTEPLASNNAKKSLNRTVFKNFADFEAQVVIRASGTGYIPDYAKKAYFITSDRTLDHNSLPDDGIGEYKKYLHPDDDNLDGEVYTENPGGGPYYALRAVRNDRFSKVANDGSVLDRQAQAWACVMDKKFEGRRHWTNPADGYLTVSSDSVENHIATVNTNNTCGHGDWRLPTKQELITLKPMHSDAYISFEVPPRTDSSGWSSGDYVWVSDDGELKALHLKKQDDYASSTSYVSSSKLMLIRDDVFHGEAFDQVLSEASTLLDLAADLDLTYDAITVDTQVTEEADIQEGFETLSELAGLLAKRKANLEASLAPLNNAANQYAALYVAQQTAQRNIALTTEQQNYQNELTGFHADADQLKIALDALFVQYDSMIASSDVAKAYVLYKGVLASSAISELYATLGATYDARRNAIDATIVTRKTEAVGLPAITLKNGYKKIAKDGSETSVYEPFGDGWRCVNQSITIDDFTTVRTWTILAPEDISVTRAQGSERLANYNADSICGIDSWRLPEKTELNLLKTEELENDENKTIDVEVFANHKPLDKNLAYYFYDDFGSYIQYALRFASENVGEDDVYDRTDEPSHVRFYHEVTTFEKADTSCGDNRTRYQDHCYQAESGSFTWNQANAMCVDMGGSLFGTDDLNNNNVDYDRLGLALGLSEDERYWMEQYTIYDAYTFRSYGNGDWTTSRESLSEQHGYICRLPLPANALPVPEAPTQVMIDDDADTFGWTNVNGYDDASHYQFTIDGGVTWSDASTNPVSVGNQALAIGDVQVRIKANESVNAAGEALASDEAYTFDDSKSQCFGGDKAVEFSDNCFVRHDTPKNRDEAMAVCAAASMELVSKDLPNIGDIAEPLELTEGTKYKLKEVDSFDYSYSLRFSSGNWSVDWANERASTAQSFICTVALIP